MIRTDKISKEQNIGSNNVRNFDTFNTITDSLTLMSWNITSISSLYDFYRKNVGKYERLFNVLQIGEIDETLEDIDILKRFIDELIKKPAQEIHLSIKESAKKFFHDELTSFFLERGGECKVNNNTTYLAWKNSTIQESLCQLSLQSLDLKTRQPAILP